MVRIATTFEEHIAILAAESPPAVVLDWWRRLDLAAREHFTLVQGRRAKDPSELEKHVSEYPRLGPRVSARINELRRRRNAIAHEDNASLTHDEAISYAREAFDLVGSLTRAWPDPFYPSHDPPP